MMDNAIILIYPRRKRKIDDASRSVRNASDVVVISWPHTFGDYVPYIMYPSSRRQTTISNYF
jgi:hypothetical protein